MFGNSLSSFVPVLKIIFNPSSSTGEAWTGSGVASTSLQDLSGHRLEIDSAAGDRIGGAAEEFSALLLYC